ncbi:glycosyltransferase [Neoroseomonas lacus]|uniref:Glycosyl transferase family 1 n=1 Tax=Neoroseomonas lacus TaxID=287609 RepID=A0A917L4I8_9PROT|nr:glycosyltransferase [Neoroseomonas lacus]GGJ44301.1 glycosyl transferase family 1 [Neoroseomonas lacus]
MVAAPPLLLHVFATFATGGPQVRYATLVNRLGGAFRHAVVAMDGRQEARALLDPALGVHFPDVGVVKGDTIGNLRRFRAALRDIRPNLLVTSNWGSIEWAMARIGTGIPHLHIEDGFGPEERTHQIRRRVFARRVLLRRATVVLPSRVLWRIARDTWRLPEQRLRLLPNGVDLGRFGRVGHAAKARSAVVVGTVAALRPEKNLARLIRAVGRMGSEVQLVIVGDGTERPALERLAVTEGIAGRVSFAGHKKDPASCYAGFDIFALSSDTEQMPLSVLEAMAAGLPVVATDVGDIAEMLDPQNRRFVVPCDDDALADALSVLALDAEARARLGAANRRRAETDFAESTMIAAWEGLFRDLSAMR